jgi:hypothetical protein
MMNGLSSALDDRRGSRQPAKAEIDRNLAHVFDVTVLKIGVRFWGVIFRE